MEGLKTKKKKKRKAVLLTGFFTAWTRQFFRPWAMAQPNNRPLSPTHLLSLGLSRPWRPQAIRNREDASATGLASATATTRRRGRRRRLHQAGSSTRGSSPPNYPRPGSTSLRCPSGFWYCISQGVRYWSFAVLDPRMRMVVLDLNLYKFVDVSRMSSLDGVNWSRYLILIA